MLGRAQLDKWSGLAGVRDVEAWAGHGIVISTLCRLPVLTVIGKCSALPQGTVGQPAGPECQSSLREDLRDPTPSPSLAPPSSALRLRAGTLSGPSPSCPRRITQYAASWAKPQMTSVRTGGWWRRQRTVRACGSLGHVGGAAVAASPFAVPESSPPHGPRVLPLSYSDTPNSGWLMGAFGHVILSSSSALCFLLPPRLA